MQNQSAKSVSSADDFKRAARARARETAEPLTLPSGLTVLARRPTPDWWIRNVGRLPQSIAARVAGDPAISPAMTPDDLVEMSRYTMRLLEYVVVEPLIRLNPAPHEVDPNLISDEDLNAIMRYAGGEIAADGSSLDRFRGLGRAAEPGAGCEALEHGTEPSCEA